MTERELNIMKINAMLTQIEMLNMKLNLQIQEMNKKTRGILNGN